MHLYSPFWLGYCAGLLCLSPLWAARDEPAESCPAEMLSMADWLRLEDHEQFAFVAQYISRESHVSRPNERFRA
jgi:hypothetical protein